MKVFKYIVLCVLGILFIACQTSNESALPISECATMPHGGIASAAVAVLDGKAYLFGGRDSAGIYQNSLWCFDPQTNSWAPILTSPAIKPRVNATICAYQDRLYLGLGFYGRHGNDTSYLRDWWQYTPATQEWKQLADYPNHYTDRATSFCAEEELYVGYGFCWNYRRDMFRYDIATNQWDSIDVGVSFHGYPTRSFGGTGTTCNGRHFMGTGYYRFSLDWWAEFLPEGQWVKRQNVLGKTRTLAASTASSDYIYLCGGVHYGGVNTTGEVLQDMLRYDPNTDQWTTLGIMPQRLMNHVCFAIDGKIYFGLGEDEQEKIHNHLYYIEE